METCVCSEIHIKDLLCGDVYHLAQPAAQVVRDMIAEGTATGDSLFQHNETLFFTVKTAEFDGEDTWTITNEFDEGATTWQGTVPTLYLVYRP